MIDARRAALLYAQMVDGFWMGWLLDRDAYSLEDATGIVSDWVLGLFKEADGRRRSSAASRSHSRQQTQTEKEKVSAACSGMIFSPATES